MDLLELRLEVRSGIKIFNINSSIRQSVSGGWIIISSQLGTIKGPRLEMSLICGAALVLAKKFVFIGMP